MSKKLKALAEKATPGPWVSFIRTSVQAVFGPDGVQPDSLGAVVNWPGFDSSDQTKVQRKANARYIAAANPAVILQLLAERDALLAERDRLREALTAMLEIHGVTQSYAETHIEIPQSWVEVSDIARAALQGAQP